MSALWNEIQKLPNQWIGRTRVLPTLNSKRSSQNLSKLVAINCVLQGSSWGPIPLLIFENDLSDVLSRNELLLPINVKLTSACFQYGVLHQNFQFPSTVWHKWGHPWWTTRRSKYSIYVEASVLWSGNISLCTNVKNVKQNFNIRSRLKWKLLKRVAEADAVLWKELTVDYN